MTRVLLVARFDASGSAPAALQQRALERLGCTVVPFDLDRSGWLDRVARRDPAARLARAARDGAPGLVLLAADDLPVLDVGALRRATPAAWAHWFSGSAVPPEAVERSAGALDLVAVPGPALAARAAAAGAATVLVLPPGCDPSVHRPLQVRAPFRSNLAFVGTATPHRESLLAPLAEFGLAIWGSGWKRTALREYCLAERLDAGDYVRACAGPTLGINLHREAGAGPCNRRLFELAAVGTAQVVEDRPGLAEYFDPETDLFVHREGQDLRELVRQALADPDGRAARAASARRRALGAHTYMHRLRALLDEAVRRRA